MNFSFIHIADIHLGRSFSIPENAYCKEVEKECENAIKKNLDYICEFAINKQIDFVLIAGDTFDYKYDFASKLIFKKFLSKLKDANIKTYVICGNHDPVDSYKMSSSFEFDYNYIKIIGLNTPCCYSEEIYKNDILVAKIHALSFQKEEYKDNPTNLFQIANDDIFHIGLLHCDLDSQQNSKYAYCLSSDLKSLKYNYWALGHIHIPYTKDEISYSGTIQGRNSKETGMHGFKYVEVENNKITKNEMIFSNTIIYDDIDIDITHCCNIEDILSLIKEKIDDYIYNKNINLFFIKLNLIGIAKCFSELNFDNLEIIMQELKENIDNSVYITKISNNTTAEINSELIKNDDGIIGEIYNTTSNRDILKQIYDELMNENKFKTIYKELECDKDDEIIKEIIDFSKNECFKICNQIYENTDN